MNPGKLSLLMLLISLFFVLGCSGRGSPVVPENQMSGSGNDIPTNSLMDAGNASSALGILGAYELTINPAEMVAELVSKRTSTIGESYIVSGIAFFTITPCKDCLKIVGFELDAGNIALKFSIKHPFNAGNPDLPPTAINRLDLDVFDLAMVIKPDATTPQNYPLMGASIYSCVVANASGYTKELSNVITDNAALPFVLVVDDSDGTSSTWNKFAMGASKEFNVAFKLTPGTPLRFSMYLTMGYGASAKRPTRLAPKYYNPEFNRKAAWKVEASAQGVWFDNDPAATTNVEVKVYDWQTGATVYGTPTDFANAPSDNVYAASEVAIVSVEIPGMNSTLSSVTTADSGSGMPSDPLIFNIPVANANQIGAGDYTGLVKVADERAVGAVPPSGDRDFLIDSPNGILLENLPIPGYATYQTFDAIVVEGCSDYCWAQTWGGSDMDLSYLVALDDSGNSYVTGVYSGTVDFNPDGGNPHTSNGNTDVFFSKFDYFGNWQWTKTWGGTNNDNGNSVAVDSYGNIYITGSYFGPVDFNPAGGGTQPSHGFYEDVFLSKFNSSGDWQWTKTWGGAYGDDGVSVAVDNSGNIYVTGVFQDIVEFNPDGGDSQSSNGLADVFLSKFSSGGNWQWSKTWGGIYQDKGSSVAADNSGNIYVSGFFEDTVEFNPDGGGAQASNGLEDVFLSKFISSGNWQWTKTWGGTIDDYGNSVFADNSGNIYVAGNFMDTVEFNPDGGGSQSANGTWCDVFLSKFNSSGNWQWSKIWGDTDDDHGYSVSLDNSGSIYVTGYFMGTVEFNPAGGGTQSSHGEEDVFLSKFNSSGIWQWSKIWGGIFEDIGCSVTVDSVNNAYVTGYFVDTVEFNPGGGDPHTSNGEDDGFLSKMRY